MNEYRELRHERMAINAIQIMTGRKLSRSSRIGSHIP
jgi:hypothetical protein